MGAFSLPGALAVAARELPSDGRVTLARTSGRLRVTGTVRPAYTVTAEAECPGDDFRPVGVAANRLQRALAATGGHFFVALVNEGRGRRVRFECDAGRVEIHVSDEPLPEVEIGGTTGIARHAVPAPALRRAIGAVLPYVAPDDNRYGLNGLHAEADPCRGRLLLGVDGNRLCAAPAPDTFPLLPRETLIRRAVAETILLDGWEGNATLIVSATHVGYTSPNLEVTSSLLKARFPDWRQVVPATWAHRVDIPAAPLRAITRAAREIGGNEASTTVRLDIHRDGTRASCRPYEMSCEAAIEGTANFDGAVGLNARFLEDALLHLAGARVTLEMSDNPLGPVRVRDADDPDGPLVIVMPVRID